MLKITLLLFVAQIAAIPVEKPGQYIALGKQSEKDKHEFKARQEQVARSGHLMSQEEIDNSPAAQAALSAQPKTDRELEEESHNHALEIYERLQNLKGLPEHMRNQLDDTRDHIKEDLRELKEKYPDFEPKHHPDLDIQNGERIKDNMCTIM